MNLLDHNFPENQLTQLRNQRIHFQKIGRDLGRPSWDDWQEIRRVLHQLKQPTFFTRDDDFYHPKYRHSGYCIVFLDVPFSETCQIDQSRRVRMAHHRIVARCAPYNLR